MNKFLSFKRNSRFKLNFGISLFRFFPARQAPDIIFNESSNNTENALIEEMSGNLQVRSQDIL
jgi:hypothetical protein